MSGQDNSLSARTTIDSVEFARQGRRRQFDVRVADLPRLADLLQDSAGTLQGSIEGESEGRQRFLRLTVAGSVNVVCARCNGTLSLRIAVDNRLLLVMPGQPWPEDETGDEPDAIEASLELNVLALVEDEILLALPIAAKHDECGGPVERSNEGDSGPFAALARLKKSN